MTSLILESSSSAACLILTKEGKPLESYDLEGGSGLSQKFFSLIESLLERKKLKWSETSFVACGKGPGAFTGVRIAAAIVQAFSFAHEIPLITFSSLQTFAPSNDCTFFNALDAKSFGLYLIKGVKEAGNVSFFGEAELASLEKCAEILESGGTLFSADALDIQKKLEKAGLTYRCFASKPCPDFLADLCHKKYLKRELSSTPLKLAYLRDT